MKLRRAKNSDIGAVLQILSQAREAQRRAGFFQWADGYPSVGTIESDIASATGYILDDKGIPAGYVVIAFCDSEYDRHPELWDTSVEYAVLHRIALSDAYRGRGVSGELFRLSEELVASRGIRCIRIDTGVENAPMQHILSARGYDCLGECDFVWGKRLAYEKYLSFTGHEDPVDSAIG